MRAKPRVLVLVLTLTLSGAAVAGCGSAPERIDPSGIDELVIPTPQADAKDFRSAASNPWFPLEAGAVSVFTHEGDTLATRTEVSVLDDGPTIEGVATVPVRKVVRSGNEVLTETTSWYAADTDGNVWLFGEEVVATVNGRPRVQSAWQAGEKGAEAGLTMPAEPRVGDGFAAGATDEGVVARAEIRDVDEKVDVAYGDFEDVVSMDVSQVALPGITETRFYARDVGLVFVSQGGDAVGEMELAERRG